MGEDETMISTIVTVFVMAFVSLVIMVVAPYTRDLFDFTFKKLKQDFAVPVVRIETLEKHPNADALDIVTAEGTTCIVKRDEYKVGDLAVLIPLDAMVVTTFQELSFLEPKAKDSIYRVKAAKLRGIFSDGIVIKGALVPKLKPGMNVADIYQIKKYEPPAPEFTTRGKQVSGPKGVPVFGLDNYKKYKHILEPGEDVVATVKIHGTSFRAGYLKDNEKFYVGSHYSFKEYDPSNVYWKAATQLNLQTIAQDYPGLFFYGEVYGSKVQKLAYGAKPGQIWLRIFDIWDVDNQRFLKYDEMVAICKEEGLPTTVEVYRGPYDPEKIEPLRSGQDPLAEHIREGIVVKATDERYRSYGRNWMRASLKLVSEEYLLKDYDTGVH